MVSEFLKHILSEKRYSLHTERAYEIDLRQFETHMKTNYELDFIEAKPEHVRGWVVELNESGLSPMSINRKLAALKSYFKFLIAREYLESNPADPIKHLKKGSSLPAFVKETEMVDLLDKLAFSDDFAGQRDKLVLEMLYGTGMRLSELQGAKEKDVDFYEKTIKVLGKRDKERILPLPNSLFHLLKSYVSLKKEMGLSSEFLIVTDSGDPIYPMFVYRKVRHYLSAVTTLSKRHPHVLRHSFATHLLNKGADLNAVKDLLGHSSLAATQVYTHNSTDKLKKVFDQAHPKA